MIHAKPAVKEKKSMNSNTILLLLTIGLFVVMYAAGCIAYADKGFTKLQTFLDILKNNAGLTILDTEYAVEDYAIGLNKGNTALLDAINGAEWMKVVYGILLSTLLGFGLGWINYKVIGRMCRNVDRLKANSFFKWAQICSGAGVAFMHGAQDGQKFMSIFVLAITLATGVGQADQMVLPIWLMFFCALNMGIGTAVGGERIIKSVGLDMVKLEPFQGFAASAATFFCLMLSTFAGLPVSTTHTNTTAIMGVGAAKRKSAVKWGIAIDMVKTWVLTFPGCGLLGFAFAHLFLMFS